MLTRLETVLLDACRIALRQIDGGEAHEALTKAISAAELKDSATSITAQFGNDGLSQEDLDEMRIQGGS